MDLSTSSIFIRLLITLLSFIEHSQANTEASACNSTSCYRYLNDKTTPYRVTAWPDVPFDTGEFYAGSLAIDKSNPNNGTLFFVFKPAIEAPVDTLTIWLNGGPGCSSLQGFLQENGPFQWQPGTHQPVKNEHTWAKLTNMLWVEQPVGTGFSRGKVTARNEVDVSEQFLGFLENFEELFGIKNYKIYMTGESYAGRYVPYISAQMLDRKNKSYFDISGALAYDPCIGMFDPVQNSIPAYQFAVANNEILNLDEAFLEKMADLASDCNFTQWMDGYLQFPPSGIQPQVSRKMNSFKCDISYQIEKAAEKKNECINVDHIVDTCPLLYDPITTYFNRDDVKKAIHAPQGVTWYECSINSVFHYTHGGGPEDAGDLSPDPIQGVLPQVIEATNRVLISNAQWDFNIITNGTLLSIQNMTWNGKLGFQSPPAKPFVVPSQGIMGKTHYERGLMWVESYQCGHMQPQYQPAACYRHLQWLLGIIDSL